MMEVVIVAVAATLGNLLMGWDSSTIAAGMTYIKKEFDLDATLEGLIVSMSFITGTIVTIFSGTVSDLVGRRPMLITSSIMFFISGLIMLWTPNVVIVLVARIVDGVAIALAVTLTPLYISEVAPADIRGQLNTLTQFACSGGMFLAYILVFSMSLSDSPSWRLMLGVISIPAVAYFLLAVFFLPESPRWLVSKGRIQEAEKVLKRLRGIEDVSGELALLAEGLSPGGEATSIEEYVVAPASDILVNQEAAKDYIKLYGPNEGVAMVAHPVNGQGSFASRSMLSQQGSFGTLAGAGLKDPIVTLFGSLHENTLPDGGGSRSMLINNANSIFSMGEPEFSPFGTSDNLHAPLMSFQGGAGEKDRAHGSKDMLGMRSTSSLRSNSSLVHGNAVETPKNTNIGGGWQLVYKAVDGAGDGKREGLQRVYLHADPAAVSHSQHVSFVSTSGYDIPIDGGEAFQAAALVSHSVLGTQDLLHMPEVAAKGPNWRALLEPGVKRALVVGIGLQILQQAAGINGFLYYAPQILEEAGVGALLSNLGLSSSSASFLVNIITTFCMLPCIGLAVKLMDIAGRRSIMLYTVPILIVCLLILVVKQFIQMNSVIDAAITAVSVIVYESVFCMGLGVIPNIICAEIFPTSVRGICISLTSLTYWGCTLIVTLVFPYLLQLLGLTGVFALFVIGCIISWIFVYLKVPETKGMPLEVIIEFFAIGADRSHISRPLTSLFSLFPTKTMPFCDVGSQPPSPVAADAHLKNDNDVVKIFYDTYGCGSTKVLLIIGLASTHEAWGPQIKGLTGTTVPNDDHDDVAWSGEEGYGGIHVCAFDNRGVGRSSVPVRKSQYSTNIMAKDAIALLDHLGWKKAHVFGHSMGAMIACKLAAMVPDRVLSLALLNVTGGGFQCFPKLDRQTFSVAYRFLKAKTPEQRAAVDLDTHYSQDYLEEYIGTDKRRAILYQQYVKAISTSGMQTNYGFDGQLNACWTHKITETEIEVIKSAGFLVSVIHGRHDIIAQIYYAKKLAERLYPVARMVDLHGGHLVSHERPEEVNQALFDLIKASEVKMRPHDWTNLTETESWWKEKRVLIRTNIQAGSNVSVKSLLEKLQLCLLYFFGLILLAFEYGRKFLRSLKPVRVGRSPSYIESQ